MATKNETLRIKIETDGEGKTKASLAGVEKGLANVDSVAQRAAGGINVTSVALKSFAALAAGAAVSNLFQLARQTIDTAAAFDDLAQASGASSTKLFQAAQLNGRSAESMNSALIELTQNMNAALADGASSAAQHFRALGVTITDTNGNLRASDQVMIDIAKRFAAAPDGIAKTTFATELLGKRNAALIPVLNTLIDDMARLGDGMSADFGAAASAFNKNIAQMQIELQNLLSQGLNPAVQGLNQFFLMARGGDTELRRTAQAIAHWEMELKKASARWRELGGVMAQPTTLAARTELRELSQTMFTAQKQIDVLKKRYGELGGTVQTTQLTPPDAAAAKKQINDAKDALEAYNARMRDAQRVFDETRTPMEKLNIEYEKLNEQLRNGDISFDTYTRATMKARDETENLKVEIDQFSKQAYQALQSNLADAFYGTMTGRFDDINDAFRDMLRKMLAQALAAGIANAILGSQSGGDNFWGAVVSGAISGLAGAGTTAAAGTTTATTTPAFANGGDFSANRDMIVGEEGVEMVRFGASGTVIPNHRLGGSETVINQSFDFRGAQPGESLRLRAEAERIKAETIATIYAQIERGGAPARIVGRR